MNYNLADNLAYCGDYVRGVSDILLYSHIPPAAIALLLAGFVIFRNRKLAIAQTLLALSTTFALWIVLNLIIWFTYDYSPLLMWAWSQIEIFSVLLFIFTLIFCYEFASGNPLHIGIKSLLLLPVLPVILLSTSLFLNVYDAQECIAVENNDYITYVLTLKQLYALATLGVIMYYFVKLRAKRLELLILGVGTFSFIYSFLLAGFISEQTLNYTYELYGLFPIIIFIGALTYLMVRFAAFNVKTIGANVIVVALVVIMTSQIFSFTTYTDLVIDIVSTCLAIIFGFFLIQSVRKEVKQREQIEQLAKRLESANKRLKVLDQMKSEFVSIASHQLRSPLTSVRGYASMLLEGSYGKLPQKAQDAVERIAESSRYMALSVEDYLNVSRIQAGRMKYEYVDFNIRDEVEHIVDEIRPAAMKKGLLLTFKSASTLKSQGIVHADIGKTRQIIHNLIDNAMKYTPKGSIEVRIRDDVKKKRVYVDIADSGVGMSRETITDLFEKFVRAKNANSVNVTGTGLGLYVAKKMAEEMDGDITATSPGEGMGSTFTLELPLAM